MSWVVGWLIDASTTLLNLLFRPRPRPSMRCAAAPDDGVVRWRGGRLGPGGGVHSFTTTAKCARAGPFLRSFMFFFNERTARALQPIGCNSYCLGYSTSCAACACLRPLCVRSVSALCLPVSVIQCVACRATTTGRRPTTRAAPDPPQILVRSSSGEAEGRHAQVLQVAPQRRQQRRARLRRLRRQEGAQRLQQRWAARGGGGGGSALRVTALCPPYVRPLSAPCLLCV